MNKYNKRHLFLDSSASTHKFKAHVKKFPSQKIPENDRVSHSNKLLKQIEYLKKDVELVKQSTSQLNLETGVGIQVEFESFPDVEMPVQSLENERQGVLLHNVKTIEKDGQRITIATAFIPEGKLDVYHDKVNAYKAQKKDKNGNALDHRKLIDSIESIRSVSFSSIWSDDNEFLPRNKETEVWWEVWLATPKRSPQRADCYQEILSDFSKLAEIAGIEVSKHILRFPEHTVIQVKASQNKLEDSVKLLFRISEIRYPKVTAEFFDAMDVDEQKNWTAELLQRLIVPTCAADSPYICIIDSGVNVEHPLLKPFADSNDQKTITSDNDPTDTIGHGTGMAGLAMWGDLTDSLSSANKITVNHRLESVKTLRFNGDNEGKPLGSITQDAVAEIEIENPERPRIFSMSLSSGEGTSRGRPSSWSSALDMLASDYLGENEFPRIFTVCAGNAKPVGNNIEYPDISYLSEVHDPAQAWNVLTIGAYTEKDFLSESSDYKPLAQKGGISPYSTTSLTWDQKNTPFKPDVVFEGGNVGQDEYGYYGMSDLQLLTTHHDFSQRYFQCANATSAATALAARFAAHIKYKYPKFWPETVRALMIHSADWTNTMYSLINTTRNDRSFKKADIVRLVRRVGFGIPNLDKALNSASNSLSLVIQDELQPYVKNKAVETNDMSLHELPWPYEDLLKIGEADVNLTITLSYFIEPNPSSKNSINKYNYASHQLRFEVKHPSESDKQFMQRINANTEGERIKSQEDKHWLLGITQRHRGSVHKDIWRGSAAELAERGQIAVYPAGGWWRTRTAHERYNAKARYALIVTLSVPDVEVDLYSAVEAKIQAMVSSQSVVL